MITRTTPTPPPPIARPRPPKRDPRTSLTWPGSSGVFGLNDICVRASLVKRPHRCFSLRGALGQAPLRRVAEDCRSGSLLSLRGVAVRKIRVVFEPGRALQED